jgi:four helix bundle protein
MTEGELKLRLKSMALRVIRLVQSLPRNVTADVLGKQLIRSATSVAANYRSACKARSRSDFLSKLGIVEEEADETQLWIEMIADSGMIKPERVKNLLTEVNEIVAIIAASRITLKKNQKLNSGVINKS